MSNVCEGYYNELNFLRKQVNEEYGTRCKFQDQNTQLLQTLKHAVKVSEDLHQDYEYCQEWQESLDLMRKTIKECE